MQDVRGMPRYLNQLCTPPLSPDVQASEVRHLKSLRSSELLIWLLIANLLRGNEPPAPFGCKAKGSKLAERGEDLEAGF